LVWDKYQIVVRGKIAFDNIYIITYNETGLIFGSGRSNRDETLSSLFEILYPVTLRMGKDELNKTLEFKFSGKLAH